MRRVVAWKRLRRLPSREPAREAIVLLVSQSVMGLASFREWIPGLLQFQVANAVRQVEAGSAFPSALAPCKTAVDPELASLG